jgi:hypothetical protein
MSYLRALITPWWNAQRPDEAFTEFPTVQASMFFVKDLALYLKEKPFNVEFPIDSIPGARTTNLETEAKEVVIHDLRSRESFCSVEQHGFEVINHKTEMNTQDFTNITLVESVYFKEMEALLKSRFHASKVVFFGWVVSIVPRSCYLILLISPYS